MKRLLWAGELALFLLLAGAIALMPLGMAMWTGRGIGLLLFHFCPSRRGIAVGNIREAVKRGALSSDTEPETLARRSFENLAVSAVELVKIYFGLGRKILGGVSVKGVENVARVSSEGRGAILLTAHAGNWELMALRYSVAVRKVAVVARPLNNPYLNRLAERSRARFGNEVIYKRGALRKLLKLLKGGGSAGILMDQAVVSGEGVVVEFMGRGAWTTRMPYLLAKRTGAAVLPVFIRRTGGGHEMTIHPELSVDGTEEEVLGRFNAAIEEHVRNNPAEWLWIHRRWKRVQGQG
jgi:KDO2-lipid IV(A) lauroyltransferase